MTKCECENVAHTSACSHEPTIKVYTDYGWFNVCKTCAQDCPHCTRHFRTLEDEEGMHDCPHCGYGPEANPVCLWCSKPFYNEEDYPGEGFGDYCTQECAIQAERDSEEDTDNG